MKNRKIIAAVLGLGIALGMCSVSCPEKISATSVDDVIAYARSVGMPEEQVQYYINMGSGGTYTSEQCDQAIAYLASYYANREDVIGGGDSPESSETGETANEPERIEEDEFIEMDVHDKQDYVSSLPSEDKKEYLDLMTNEEKNQLVKELDPSKQVELISGMLGVGDAFGYEFSIENVSDGAIMLSARDESGSLVGVTVLGDSVEKTGKPYLIPITAFGGLILLSAAGLIMLVRKCR